MSQKQATTSDAVRLSCPFCGGMMRKRVITEPELALMVGLYLAHLIESHWDVLEAARESRLKQGPVNDAWTRL